MSSGNLPVVLSVEDVEDKVDRAFESGPRDHDIPMSMRLWRALAMTRYEELTDVQQRALDVAEQFASGRCGDDERIAALGPVSKKLDELMRIGEDFEPHAALNRLVFASLIAQTGLTYDDAHYALEIAEYAGLSTAEVDGAFRSVVPEYANLAAARDRR